MASILFEIAIQTLPLELSRRIDLFEDRSAEEKWLERRHVIVVDDEANHTSLAPQEEMDVVAGDFKSRRAKNAAVIFAEEGAGEKARSSDKVIFCESVARSLSGRHKTFARE